MKAKRPERIDKLKTLPDFGVGLLIGIEVLKSHWPQ
jgi:hypothetical protein